MNKQINQMLMFLVMLMAQVTFAQQTTISGTVTDESGVPLPGTNVVEKGTSNGTSSDFDGNYTINASEGATLIFTSLGFTSKEVVLTGQSIINISLVENSEQLGEVVVTALGIRKEQKALGYSLTEVDGDEISTIKQTNAINSLQGKIAGVNITQNSTGAAGSSRVVIRGASSLSGNNQPLYVVNGVPIGNDTNGSAGLFGGVDGGDGISSLNPDDIETMSVLKGGAASALYGSRASGGVIIITTKSGKNQEGFGVDFNSSVIFEKVDTRLQDFQTEYGQGTRGRIPANEAEAFDLGLNSWGARLNGSPVVQWDGVSRPYAYVGSNADYFYRPATTAINTISLTKGSENLNFRLSASNLSNRDIIPNSGLNRKTFSLSSGATLADKLTTQVNAQYIIENVNNRPRLSDAPGNGNFTVANLPPNVDVRTMDPGANPDGTERRYSSNTFSQNPYYAANNFSNQDTKNRIIASTTLRYDILDWLYLSGRTGIDHQTINGTSVEPFGTAYKPLGGMSLVERRYTQVDADLILGVEKDITDKFSTSAFVGMNKNQIKSEVLNLGGNDFVVPGLEDIGNLAQQTRSRTFTERQIGSVYGSIELSWDRWAYITFTGRNDWFSTLSFPGKTSPNNDFYPSVNASLVLSDAFQMPEPISFLKLRGGYSEVAGGAQDAYQLALTYEIFGQGFLGQPLGRVNGSTVPNSNLVPFSKTEAEIGLDARFFNNRLSLDLALYKNKTTQDIVDVSTSITSSYNAARANLGEIENKGVELLLSGSPIRTDNFKWTTSINGAYNQGTVLATNDDNANVNLDEPRTQNVRITHVVGENYGTIFGVSYDRDDNGVIKYVIDGEGVPRAVEGERKILGNGVPPLTLGFTNTFSYKNFDLTFLIDGKFGGQIFSGTNTVLYGNGLHKNTLDGRANGLTVTGISVDDAGENPVPFTTVVAPSNLQTYYGELNDIAEEFVADSDYIKLRQLSLGYTLPNKFLERTFFSSLNFQLIASNLFFIKRSVENIDPESAYTNNNSQGLEYFGVPSTRSYGLNVNVKF